MSLMKEFMMDMALDEIPACSVLAQSGRGLMLMQLAVMCTYTCEALG
jgi:hypothetical protein